MHFSNNECSASFHVFGGHLYVFFEEISFSVFRPLFDWVVCFFVVIQLHELLVNFGDESFVSCFIYKPYLILT